MAKNKKLKNKINSLTHKLKREYLVRESIKNENDPIMSYNTVNYIFKNDRKINKKNEITNILNDSESQNNKH